MTKTNSQFIYDLNKCEQIKLLQLNVRNYSKLSFKRLFLDDQSFIT